MYVCVHVCVHGLVNVGVGLDVGMCIQTRTPGANKLSAYIRGSHGRWVAVVYVNYRAPSPNH